MTWLDVRTHLRSHHHVIGESPECVFLTWQGQGAPTPVPVRVSWSARSCELGFVVDIIDAGAVSSRAVASARARLVAGGLVMVHGRIVLHHRLGLHDLDGHGVDAIVELLAAQAACLRARWQGPSSASAVHSS